MLAKDFDIETDKEELDRLYKPSIEESDAQLIYKNIGC